MRVNKENARKAIKLMNETTMPEKVRDSVIEFLEAAERKLPTESAYDRDQKKSNVQQAAEQGFNTIHTDSKKYPSRG